MFEQIYQSEPVDLSVDSKLTELVSIIGLTTVPDPTVNSNNRLLAHIGMHTTDLFGGLFQFPYWFTWDEVTGHFFPKAMRLDIGPLVSISISNLIKTRAGRLCIIFGFAGLVDGTLAAPYRYPPTGFYSPQFHRPDGATNGCPAIDEFNSIYMDRGSVYGSDVWVVWDMITGLEKSKIQMPSNIIASCLESENHVYLLCDNGIMVLYDYVREQIRGTGRLPLLGDVPGGIIPAFGSTVAITYDIVLKRLYVFSKNFVNDAGHPVIRGYRLVSKASRLTKPVPLVYPRPGKVIPVMTQLVDDLNAGIGGSIVTATVSGAGHLVQNPSFTDTQGASIFQVECDFPGVIHAQVDAQ
jgi:hypothetical protein